MPVVFFILYKYILLVDFNNRPIERKKREKGGKNWSKVYEEVYEKVYSNFFLITCVTVF